MLNWSVDYGHVIFQSKMEQKPRCNPKWSKHHWIWLMHEHGIKWFYHRANRIPRDPLAWTFNEFLDKLLTYFNTTWIWNPPTSQICHIPSLIVCLCLTFSTSNYVHWTSFPIFLINGHPLPPSSLISKSLQRKWWWKVLQRRCASLLQSFSFCVCIFSW